MLAHSLISNCYGEDGISPVANEPLRPGLKDRLTCHNFGTCFVNLPLAMKAICLPIDHSEELCSTSLVDVSPLPLCSHLFPAQERILAHFRKFL